MFKIALITHSEAPIEGQNSYSPGLQYDARVYADYFSAAGTEIVYIKPWGRGEGRIDLTGVRAVIGFEEMGDISLLHELRTWKRNNKTDQFHICLVPNLEVMQTRGKWSATLENLDLIDIFIAKTPSLIGLIEKWAAHQPKKNPKARVVRVFHSTPNNGEVVNFAATRRNIIHFAGASYLKNTLEACRAGIELVREHSDIFQKFIIKITKWPSKHDTDGIIALDRIAGTFAEVKKLCDENKEIVELIVSGFMSDAHCAELYNTARLAICCSNAEGFGHSIVDAMRFGCLVVTTDGLPMRDLAAPGRMTSPLENKLVPQGRMTSPLENKLVPQGRMTSPLENKLVPQGRTALARPTARRSHNFGLYYDVPAANIVRAAETLDLAGYNEDIARQCVANYTAIANKNKEDLLLFNELIMQ